MGRKITDINNSESVSNGLSVSTDSNNITFNTSSNHFIAPICIEASAPTSINLNNSNLGISLITKVTSKDDISVGADITEILFRSKFTMHIYKDCNVDFTEGIDGWVSVIDDNTGLTTEYCNKKDNQFLIECKFSDEHHLTFNNKIAPFTITNISSNTLLKLDIIKKAKAFLIAQSVLTEMIHDSKTIECTNENLRGLARQNDKNFLRDYLVCKDHELPLPPEIMDIIGSYINSEIKAFSTENGFNISLSTHEFPQIMGLINTDSNE